jgi:branched-chain amino acid transport system ATP-binding protein
LPERPLNSTEADTLENPGTPRLRLERVSTYYGEAQVLKEISLTVQSGQIVALLGSNGAGKTTLLKTLTGLLTPRSGTILFEGQPWKVCRRTGLLAGGSPAFPRGGNYSAP